MFEALQDHGVTWKVYQPENTSVGALEHLNLAIGFNALLYFQQYLADPASELYRRAFLPGWPDEFAADVRANTLPSVSWLIPTLTESEHPSAAPQNGAGHVFQALTTLLSNPQVWAKTVVFITYDENGGFFDHVPPPTAPKGTPGEELTVSPLPEHAAGIAGPIGLGFRVPTLVVSPFSRGGYVNSDVFDHTSLLRFLETRFDVKAPNISAWRRKTVGDLTSTLALGKADITIGELPTPANQQAALDAACPENADPESLLSPAPALKIPTKQKQPKQESGRARRR
jgi:phospholipase C